MKPFSTPALALASLGVVGLASGARSDDRWMALEGCHHTVRNILHDEHRHTRDVVFYGEDVDQSQSKEKVRGQVEFYNKDGERKNYSYRCIYHRDSGDTSDVSVEKD